MSTSRMSPQSIDLEPIRPLIERIRAVLQPKELWLFGSRARGTHHAWSDWDLAAILPDEARDELFEPAYVWRATTPDRWSADLLLLEASEFAEDAQTPNTIAWAVAHEGIRIDER